MSKHIVSVLVMTGIFFADVMQDWKLALNYKTVSNIITLIEDITNYEIIKAENENNTNKKK